ncbi:hypothetical protein [Thermoleptolyngbya sp.]
MHLPESSIGSREESVGNRAAQRSPHQRGSPVTDALPSFDPL